MGRNLGSIRYTCSNAVVRRSRYKRCLHEPTFVPFFDEAGSAAAASHPHDAY